MRHGSTLKLVGSRPSADRYACAQCGAHKLVQTATTGCCEICGACELVPVAERQAA
jgi:hypothetical protein